MVTSTYNKFNTAVEGFANGLFQASTGGLTSTGGTLQPHTFTFLLTNTLPTADMKTSTALTLITAQNGYAAGGSTVGITSSTLGSTGTVPCPVIVLASTVVFTASSANSTAGIGPFRYTVFADQTAVTGIISSTGGAYLPLNLQTSTGGIPTGFPLISWYDYGSNLTLTPGETFTISPDGSSGIFQIA